MTTLTDGPLMTAGTGVPGRPSRVRLTAMLDELAAQLGLHIKQSKGGPLVHRDGEAGRDLA